MAQLWRLRSCRVQEFTAFRGPVVGRAETLREVGECAREKFRGRFGFAEADMCFSEPHAGVRPSIVPFRIRVLDVLAPPLQVRQRIFILALHDQDPSHREVGGFVIPVSFRERRPHDFCGASGIGLLVILKQIPHSVGWVSDPMGDLAFNQPAVRRA